MATLPFRPPLGLAMSFAELVCQYREASEAERRFSAIENDHAAQSADEEMQAISTELRDRLQSFVGMVPLEQVLGAL